LGIAAASAHPTEAYEFLQWIGTDEGQQAMLENGSPTAYRTKALADPAWIGKYPVLAAMSQLKPQPLRGATNFVEMEQKVYELLSLFYAGELSAEEAIAQAQDEANAVIAAG
jgi:ABC-type glycerol-3-phosphate transport system substrate-binding protein